MQGGAAAAPLPLVVSVAELHQAQVSVRAVEPGQTLELLGFPRLRVERSEAQPRLRRLASEHHQLDMPADGGGLSLLFADGRRLEVYTHRSLDAKTEVLNDYQIGQYPPVAERGPAYRRPSHLVQVLDRNRTQPVSEHFQIGQFLCKQEAQWPRFVAVSATLLQKLELLVTRLQRRGIPVQTLHVMSGYRTPAYNRALGNVAYSRHIYGDAADVFVDVNGDGMMDDLNGDGVSDVKDAVWLLGLLDTDEQALGSAEVATPGGLGAYRATAYHGPFLHIDTRGVKARWGHQPVVQGR